MNEFKKKCPKCDCEIFYKSEAGYKNSIKNNSQCRKCASSGENNHMFGKFGELNQFFGKKHTKETLEKQSKIKLGKKHSKTSLDKMKGLSSGDKNGMFGKSFYEIWVDKFGEEIANEKLNLFKNKQSINNSGSGNSMFGKPSPTGSGNGWSGWYKGWYFRSLIELTYMIKIIERFNLKWVSGESKKYKISYYDFKGNDRNYFPDFIINSKYIVECKPKKLWTSDNVIRKKNAAIEYCLKNGLIYKMVDIGKISNEEVKILKENGSIIFLPRYEKKYNEMFDKLKK